MANQDIHIGTLVTFIDGILKDKVYRVIKVLESTYICEDENGSRFTFTHSKVLLADEAQTKSFYHIK